MKDEIIEKDIHALEIVIDFIPDCQHHYRDLLNRFRCYAYALIQKRKEEES